MRCASTHDLIDVNPYKKFRAALVLFTLGTWNLWYSAVPERKTDRDHLLQVRTEPDGSQCSDSDGTASSREAISVVTVNGPKKQGEERGERRAEIGERRGWRGVRKMLQIPYRNV